MVKVTGFN